MTCSQCRKAMPSGTRICPYCGARVTAGSGPSLPGGQRGRILPWPQWKWQRRALFTAIPAAGVGVYLGMGLIAEGDATGVILLLAGLALVGTACYAGIKTSWLQSTAQAPRGTRIAGGVAIVWGLLLIVTLALSVILGVVLAIVMIVLLVKAIGSIGSSPDSKDSKAKLLDWKDIVKFLQYIYYL